MRFFKEHKKFPLHCITQMNIGPNMQACLLEVFLYIIRVLL